MGTDLGDAEKVSDLLEQWAMNRHAILLMIVGVVTVDLGRCYGHSIDVRRSDKGYS
jgi:hypothetical protein